MKKRKEEEEEWARIMTVGGTHGKIYLVPSDYTTIESHLTSSTQESDTDNMC